MNRNQRRRAEANRRKNAALLRSIDDFFSIDGTPLTLSLGVTEDNRVAIDRDGRMMLMPPSRARRIAARLRAGTTDAAYLDLARDLDKVALLAEQPGGHA